MALERKKLATVRVIIQVTCPRYQTPLIGWNT